MEQLKFDFDPKPAIHSKVLHDYSPRILYSHDPALYDGRIEPVYGFNGELIAYSLVSYPSRDFRRAFVGEDE